jgi:hypothetical protein
MAINPVYAHIPELMRVCEQRDELQRCLRAAFEEWYAVKDVPGKNREAKAAEEKVHQVQRSLEFWEIGGRTSGSH